MNDIETRVGGRHRRAVRRRVRLGRHLHRRQHQLHDDLDARAGRGHLAGRRAQGQGRHAELLQGAQPVHQGGSDLPRAPRRGVRADHHPRHGRAAPRDLHRAHEARVRLRSHRRQAAGRLPRDDQPARRSSTTPTRSRPVARASTARWRATSSRCRPSTSRGYEFVDEIVGGVDPARVHPGLRQGLPRGDQEGPLDRLPDRRRSRASSTTARRTRSTRPKWRSARRR